MVIKRNLSTASLFTESTDDYNVLIVEDDIFNFMYIKEVIELSYPRKIKIFHVENGSDAVDFCRNHNNIKIVLMDIKMPVMNGYEATIAIKKIRPSLPIIAQTAYAMHEDKLKAIKAGCNDYFAKPVKREAIMTIFQKYIVKSYKHDNTHIINIIYTNLFVYIYKIL